MKRERTRFFIVISAFALLMVLFIQVSWIFHSAKIKEEMFNERANMVLARTTEALLADQATCRSIENSLGKKEVETIDSLFNHYMKFYDFHVDYSFEVVRPDNFEMGGPGSFSFTNSLPVLQNEKACYEEGLDQVANATGWKLKLLLPEKRQFIMEEMGTLFITSLILIMVVLFLFWKTTQSLMLEKKISEHTTDFLNNMTHEFKTPLANIGLAGRMIMKESAVKDDDKVKYYSGIILDENEKLKQQVEHVLSMSALERGEIPLQKTVVDCHELIHDVLKRMEMMVNSREGNVELNLNAEQFILDGDKTHLTNAFCNLVDNAIKYSDGKPHIMIHTSNLDKNLIITIKDRGIGIEKDYHDKVFDKFFRVPTGDVHNTKGFGLGLSYIKKIVELHHGFIDLKSEKGKGTSFIITLPYA